jgi:predicted GNAT superfamily acetyltransferase
VQGVHKIIWLASRLAHTLSNHLIATRLENLHVKIRSLIKDMEPNKKSNNVLWLLWRYKD